MEKRKIKIISSSKKLLTPNPQACQVVHDKSEVQRKKRSEEYCKRKRKRYRQKKKRIANEVGEKLALEALKCRWRERYKNACAAEEAAAQEREKVNEEEMLRAAELQKAKAAETARHECEIENTATHYSEICEEERNDTSPLLLSPAIVPIAEPSCSCTNTVVSARCKELLEDARRERNNAIMLARGYRDMAEQCQTEKRKLKYKLEEKVEVVRNFWRNSVLEGSSRSGLILRAALIRNNQNPVLENSV